MPEVVLEHVSKVYPGNIHAVRDLNLNVADGEQLVLVGPSGSGKTTVLRLIAGLETPTTGAIRMTGQVVNALPPRDRNVAMVFQRQNLYPHLSVRDNLAFGPRLHQRSWLKRLCWRYFRPQSFLANQQQEKILFERIAATAHMLDLEEILERKPEHLSGGQQQRVALGRALVRQAAVWLLDEPLNSLDPHLRADLRNQLHLLHRRLRATIVYVTHDHREAMRLGERMAILDCGVVQQVGRPSTLCEQPRNRFVAGFLGWPAMNFMDGRLKHQDGQIYFASRGQLLRVPPCKSKLWAAFAEREVTVGIRPEHVSLQPTEEFETSLTMEVAWTETMENIRLATLRRDDWQLTAQLKREVQVRDGQTVEVTINMQQAHLFDRRDGLTLGTGVPTG